jgi:alkyldihydroxyacetonephosphate synthase
VITQVRVRIHPPPATTRYEAWSFPDFATGADALRAVVQTGTGPTVIRLSDEAETGINLATTEHIGEQQITGGCLAVTVFEGSAEHTGGMPRRSRCSLRTAARRWVRAPARSLGARPLRRPLLRDGLLAAGALCETLETATQWSGIGALKAAVTAALTDTLADSGTAALVLCHIHMCTRPAHRCTSPSSPRSVSSPVDRPRRQGNGVDAIMRTGGISPITTPSAPITGRG